MPKRTDIKSVLIIGAGPIGLGAARNIAPMPIYLICRGIVAISRALQEIIVAILLVAIFGFGPLAGFLTLSFATIGFLSKLLAEDIESMDRVQAEAIKAQAREVERITARLGREKQFNKRVAINAELRAAKQELERLTGAHPRAAVSDD